MMQARLLFMSHMQMFSMHFFARLSFHVPTGALLSFVIGRCANLCNLVESFLFVSSIFYHYLLRLFSIKIFNHLNGLLLLKTAPPKLNCHFWCILQTMKSGMQEGNFKHSYSVPSPRGLLIPCRCLGSKILH